MARGCTHPVERQLSMLSVVERETNRTDRGERETLESSTGCPRTTDQARHLDFDDAHARACTDWRALST
jgi:hypothetical protein